MGGLYENKYNFVWQQISTLPHYRVDKRTGIGLKSIKYLENETSKEIFVMKKLMALALAGIMAISVCACGNSASTASTATTVESEKEETSETASENASETGDAADTEEIDDRLSDILERDTSRSLQSLISHLSNLSIPARPVTISM